MNSLKNQKISHWIFDLDNTLYSSETNLFSQIKKNIVKFISNEFKIEESEADKERLRLYKKFGTSLRGLIVEKNINPKRFLDYVHDIDVSSIKPNISLNILLNKINEKKIIFTNASLKHAENILSVLGLSNNFSSIYSIETINFLPKPNMLSYKMLIDKENIDSKLAIMFEDTSWNLEPAFELGMKTVLVNPQNEIIDKDIKYINYRVKTVEGFLKEYFENKI
tara:strand:- start:2606 stop:3274 length:669 start_codon:yes stop_codon:yes gene_type:complete